MKQIYRRPSPLKSNALGSIVIATIHFYTQRLFRTQLSNTN